MPPDFRTALAITAAAAAIAMGVFTSVLLRPDPETWRVVASGASSVIFVGALVAVAFAVRRRAGSDD